MAQEEGNKDITLDDLLRIVDTAAHTIERLQAVNASLVRQMRECESAAQAASADADNKARQIEELERSEAALREDAEWCRWFKNKYEASTFFSHIEREYQNEHALLATHAKPENGEGASRSPDASSRSNVAPDGS